MKSYRKYGHLAHCRSLDLRYVATAEVDRPDDDLASLAVQLRAAEAAQVHMIYAALRYEMPVLKIGTSRRLSGNAGRLRRMPGARLVALAPGGRVEERELHQRFADSRVTADLPGYGKTEHFRLTEELVEWVNETRGSLNLRPVTIGGLLRYSAAAA